MGRTFYWMLMPYRRYADFDGRSQRIEYWLFMLFYVAVFALLLTLIMAGMPWAEIMAQQQGAPPPADAPGPLTWLGFAGAGIFWLVSFVPSIAVTVRRFHDQDRSGWFYLLNFVPYGTFVVLVFMCLEGTRGPNRFGDDPKDPYHEEVFA